MEEAWRLALDFFAADSLRRAWCLWAAGVLPAVDARGGESCSSPGLSVWRASAAVWPALAMGWIFNSGALELTCVKSGEAAAVLAGQVALANAVPVKIPNITPTAAYITDSAIPLGSTGGICLYP